MRSFLLLVLSLNTGCLVSEKVQGCTGGWVDFTCRYPNPNTNYRKIKTPRRNIENLGVNTWQAVGKELHLYHNTTGRHLRMIVNPIGNKDFGEYKCEFKEKKSEKFCLRRGTSVCLKDLVQTTYRTAQTTIDCDHQGFNFICKDNGFTCDTILRQTSSLVKTISNVSLQDAGVYWCGSESQTQGYRVSRRKIHLDVKGELRNTLVIVVVVAVLLLLLLLAVFFIYKRFNRVDNTTENQQEHCYEEIEERPQKPGLGTAPKTIYTTVTLPSELPSEPLYFTLDHPTSAQTTSTEINPSTSSSDKKFTLNDIYSTMDTPQQTASS